MVQICHGPVQCFDNADDEEQDDDKGDGEYAEHRRGHRKYGIL